MTNNIRSREPRSLFYTFKLWKLFIFYPIKIIPSSCHSAKNVYTFSKFPIMMPVFSNKKHCLRYCILKVSNFSTVLPCYSTEHYRWFQLFQQFPGTTFCGNQLFFVWCSQIHRSRAVNLLFLLHQVAPFFTVVKEHFTWLIYKTLQKENSYHFFRPKGHKLQQNCF